MQKIKCILKAVQKSHKIMPTKNNFVVVLASKFRGINPHATWGTAGTTFDGGWGTR